MLSEKGKTLGGLHSPKELLTQGLGGQRRRGEEWPTKSKLHYLVLLLYGAWEHRKRKLPKSYRILEQRQLRNYEARGHLHLADGESEAQAIQAMTVAALTHLLEGCLFKLPRSECRDWDISKADFPIFEITSPLNTRTAHLP